MMEYRLLVQIEPVGEGGYLAVCPQIQGCHAEGHTVGEALDNLRSVAQVIEPFAQSNRLLEREDA
jgi:predicted RNase H-like HicB family nuclease